MERAAAIWKELGREGSGKAARSTNEFKRHPNLFLEKGKAPGAWREAGTGFQRDLRKAGELGARTFTGRALGEGFSKDFLGLLISVAWDNL